MHYHAFYLPSEKKKTERSMKKQNTEERKRRESTHPLNFPRFDEFHTTLEAV
jgi:hypothetical protein